jgi:hypothetical protein
MRGLCCVRGGFKNAGDGRVAVLGALFAQRSANAEALLVKVASIRPFGLSASHVLRQRSPPLLAKYCSKLVHRLDRLEAQPVGGRPVKILEIFLR